MSVNSGEKFINLNHLNMLAQKADQYLDQIAEDQKSTIIYAAVNPFDNTIIFCTAYNITDSTTLAQFKASIDNRVEDPNETFENTGADILYHEVRFPNEIQLMGDLTHIQDNFLWEEARYPGSTNPNLDGHKVLVLCITESSNSSKYSYFDLQFSFIDLQDLIQIFSTAVGDSSKVLTIANYQVTFNVSATANNALTINNDGLYVTTADKIDTVSSANGKVGVFDANGQLVGGVDNDSIITSDYQYDDDDDIGYRIVAAICSSQFNSKGMVLYTDKDLIVFDIDVNEQVPQTLVSADLNNDIRDPIGMIQYIDAVHQDY